MKLAVIKMLRLYLNELRRILTSNLERSPLMHGYYYASANDRSNLCARFSLTFVPCEKYAGNP